VSRVAGVAGISGVAFGVGLALAGLTQPEVVVGFLDVGGRWDPTLAVVMVVATVVNAAFVALAARRGRPVFGAPLAVASARHIDARLVGGAALFGIGWGLAGVCPGPALASLGSADPSVLTFVGAMAAGLVLVDVVAPDTRPSMGAPQVRRFTERKEQIMATRIAVLVFGVVSYGLFLVSFLYAIGFVGGFGVPTTIDGMPVGSVAAAVAIDGILLMVFALQHSVMARPWFKAIVTRVVPEAAERSLYVLASSAALLLLFWLWRPIGGTVWEVADPVARAALYGVFAVGWLTVLVTTFLINHFDLFGLRQVWLYLRGRPYTQLRFGMPGLYRHVRHPLYVGWFLAFWATPTMTVTHLFFAVVTTAYILVAIRFEERDLEAAHGPAYAEYRRTVPMFVPRLRRSVEIRPLRTTTS
jgi:protein-S-isoprenylcysteine O-methyltransferase Ste14